MSESVDTELLRNCTILAVNRFTLVTKVNDSKLYNWNRSEVVNLLSGIIENKKGLPNINEAKDFLTECLFPSPTRPYELPWEQKTVWAFVFGLMLCIAIIGNGIVLWIVAGMLQRHRSMRTVTNYFLLNLSIADLLMSMLNCIFNFIFMLNSDWPFGSVYCTVNNFMANVTVSTSVFTLVAISFDRYIAIVHPLKRRTSRRKVRIILFLIWILSCVLAVPCLMYSHTVTKRYNIIILILTYGIPMLVMMICYFLMGRVLWGSRSIGENTDRQIESMKSKRKVVRMFIAIVSIFAVCWLPYHMFFIYSYHDNKVTSTRYVQHMYLGFYWLAMSNAMVNPIIYYWMNKRFRKYFQQIICCRFLNSAHIKITNKGLRSSINRKMEYVTDVNVKWKRSTMETQIQAAHISIKGGSSNNQPLASEKTSFVKSNLNENSSPAYICFDEDHEDLKIRYICCDDENNAVVTELG